MNFDQYFRDRGELVTRVLLEPRTARAFPADWRFFGAGVACLMAAPTIEIWASISQSDPGFFARTSTFLMFLLLAGLWLLSLGLASDFLLSRLAVSSHNAVKEKTLHHLLKIDASLAHKLLGKGS